jgi:hypothetical protein
MALFPFVCTVGSAVDAVTAAHDGDVQMIDSSSVRVHQHAANTKKAVEIVVWAAAEED